MKTHRKRLYGAPASLVKKAEKERFSLPMEFSNDQIKDTFESKFNVLNWKKAMKNVGTEDEYTQMLNALSSNELRQAYEDKDVVRFIEELIELNFYNNKVIEKIKNEMSFDKIQGVENNFSKSVSLYVFAVAAAVVVVGAVLVVEIAARFLPQIEKDDVLRTAVLGTLIGDEEFASQASAYLFKKLHPEVDITKYLKRRDQLGVPAVQ